MTYRRSIPWMLGALVATASWSQAPTPPPPPGAPPTPMIRGMRGPNFAGQPVSFQLVGGEPMFFGPPVVNAPYSAETVSTTTRVLADGTRIENTSTSKVYRDSEGRTRREQSFPFVGALVANDANAGLQITITDPVAGKTYLLDTTRKTARTLDMPALPPRPPHPPTPSGDVAWESASITTSAPVDPSAAAATTIATLRTEVTSATPAAGTMFNHVVARRFTSDENVQVEDLGVQQIEGVAATGVRRTVTIPTGTIGNDRPITSTTEEWFSQELGMTVKRITKDPQIGEIVYQVQSLNRNEPAKDLFEVPADYTVVEQANIMMRQAPAKEE